LAYCGTRLGQQRDGRNDPDCVLFPHVVPSQQAQKSVREACCAIAFADPSGCNLVCSRQQRISPPAEDV
jgi:hypothetical protein